jgi:hypothetical protein
MKFLSALLLSLILIACTFQATPAPTSKSSACGEPVSWELTFDVSGGFAGRREHLELSNAGLLIAVDENAGQRIETQAAQVDLDMVAGLLAGVCLEPGADKSPDGCADCFEYHLVVLMDGQTYEFHFNDVSLAESQLKALINNLSELLQRTLEAN